MRPSNCRGSVRAALRVAGLFFSQIVLALCENGFVPFEGHNQAARHRFDVGDSMALDGPVIQLKSRMRARKFAEEMSSGLIDPGVAPFAIIYRSVS